MILKIYQSAIRDQGSLLGINKSNTHLKQGHKIWALINSDNGSILSLKLVSGQSYKAMCDNKNFNTGEWVLFNVKNIEKDGTILMGKISDITIRDSELAGDYRIISLLNTLKNGSEIVEEMNRNGLSINFENIYRVYKIASQNKDIPLSEIVFILANKIELTKENVELLEQVLKHSHLLGDEIKKVINYLKQTFSDNITGKDEIIEWLMRLYTGIGEDNKGKSNILNSENVNRLLNVIKYIGSTKDSGAELITNVINDIMSKQNFITGLQENILVFQLPIKANEHMSTLEMYVLKDETENKKKMNIKSIYITLETEEMGKIGTLIIINNTLIGCHFRIENYEFVNLINDNLETLKDSIFSSGYRLETVTFQQIPEDINIFSFKNLVDSYFSNSSIRFDKKV